MKAQLAESRSKCELLEQSLRVLAQENFELEADKSHSTGPNNKTSATTEAIRDNDNLGDNISRLSTSDSDGTEEFFDTANDNFTEDDQSFASTSFQNSQEDLKSVTTEENTLVEMSNAQKTENSIDLLETDEYGWR